VREYAKLHRPQESFEAFHDRILTQYTPAYIGFYMQLGAYMRTKNIDVDISIDAVQKTGKNEDFELFELGRKLYYRVTKEEAYSAYDHFTNLNKREKLQDIKKIIPDLDENFAKMLHKMLDNNEDKRAFVFSELAPLISLT
jgi:ferredoxin-nitrite reductase